MSYYEFIAGEQMWNNWLLFTEEKKEPSLRLKPRYRPFCCPKCGKFDHDAIFKEGFESDVEIRARGDIIATDDGFHCINEKVSNILASEGYGGIKLKALGSSGWHVLNITLRVKSDPAAYELHKPFCRQCKRASEVTGLLDCLSQVAVPNKSRTFFSTITDRHCSGYFDRPVFVTEDIMTRLTKAGIKSGKYGMFQRLLDAGEEVQLKASIAKGKARWPARSKIPL
jgi:hypothetical protein